MVTEIDLIGRDVSTESAYHLVMAEPTRSQYYPCPACHRPVMVTECGLDVPYMSRLDAAACPLLASIDQALPMCNALLDAMRGRAAR
jgi:hypothetical protein